MFVYTIQPVVKPVVQPDWQPVWQQVVSCKRGFRTPLHALLLKLLNPVIPLPCCALFTGLKQLNAWNTSSSYLLTKSRLHSRTMSLLLSLLAALTLHLLSLCLVHAPASSLLRLTDRSIRFVSPYFWTSSLLFSINLILWLSLVSSSFACHMIMVALWNRADHYIFMLCFILLLLSFFSSPNLSRRGLDVRHTSTHGVALVRL